MCPAAAQTASHLGEDVVKRCSQHAVGRGFPSEGFAHHHEAVTHDHHLIDLQDFLSKEVGDLQVHGLAVFCDGVQENVVVSIREHHTREEIGGDTLQQ